MNWKPAKESRRLGPLQCLERPGRDPSFSENAKAPPHIILFHGFGADAYDLFPLADVLDPEGRFHWLFPMGFLEVPIGPGFFGRAWWKVDILALQQNPELDRTATTPDGMAKARQNVDGFLADLKKFSGLENADILIGGFSQGAMITTDLALRSTEDFGGLLVMSGTLICKPDWEAQATKHKSLRVFVSHGRSDPVLPFKGAERLLTLLQQAGLKTEWVPFNGTHEIPPEVLKRAQKFIRDWQ